MNQIQPIRARGMSVFARSARTAVTAMLALLISVSAAAADSVTNPSQFGDYPTTGGVRPGVFGSPPSLTAEALPTAIQIDSISVNAQIETIKIVNGVMQNPTGPWVVSWYRETSKLGQIGNTVLAGHLDYWDVGPAVFANMSKLKESDRIAVTGNDGHVYRYQVDWVRLYNVADAPVQMIVGPTATESLTLITCGGPFDSQTGVYLQRTIVRAHRVTN